MATRPPSITRALTAALKAAQGGPADAAAVALARRYAALIDRAEHLAEELAGLRAEDDDQAKQLAALKARVDAQTVASDLGPKLLAALTALKLTPSARAAIAAGEVKPGDRPAANPVARLRAVHARTD